MNLRHNKPAQSYSEPIYSHRPNKSDLIKRDPLLKLHAEQLVKFINRANQRLTQYKSQQLSKSKTKPKKYKRSQIVTNKNIKKKPVQSVWQTSNQSPSKSLKIYINNEIQSDSNMSSYQSTKIQDDGQFQFQTLRNEWLVEPTNYMGTITNMTRLCMCQPKYYPILYRMYNDKHFIQNFKPEQLAIPSSLLAYRLFPSGYHRS